MLYTRRLFQALRPAMSKGKEKVTLSDNTLREVILKTIGKPTSSDEKSYFKRNIKSRGIAPCFAGEVRPKLRLVASAIDHSELPSMTLPEVAFYGRTNAGKSCLINALCGRFAVCPVKDLPGTTRKLHFYKVGSPASLILVDLPGYGYSSAKEDITLQWNEFTLSYLKYRRSLVLVVILIDSRLGLKESDKEVINFCDKYKIRWQVVMAKADTMKPVLLAKMMHKVKLETRRFKSNNGKIIPVSATKNQNLDELRTVVDAFKVDKQTARHWSKEKPKKVDRPESRRKSLDASLAAEKAIGQSDWHEGIIGPIKTKSRPNVAIVERYNLYKYLEGYGYPSSMSYVALECMADIFATMTPPPGLTEEIEQEVDAFPVVLNAPIPVVEKIEEPTFVEYHGSLMCNINLNIGDTLTKSEDTETMQENLIADKIESYRKRVAMGMEETPKVSRPNIGRSYKRVLSFYKKELKRTRVSWNAGDQAKLTWSAVYQKWEKWSKKHPELAGTIAPPTKRDILAIGRKEHMRKRHLQVHEQREKLRKASPKIDKRLSL